ncbi:MAG: hypothetical protein H6563_01150 [Lewinellaceae bacterium]|nr:hypothetical protein [Lewinellaceae bacterium]
MKKFALQLIILLWSLPIAGQGDSLFIQINKADFNECDPFDFLRFKINVTNQGFGNLGEIFEFPASHSAEVFCKGWLVITNDSSSVRLPVSNGDDYIEMSAKFLSGLDSVVIDRIDFWEHCQTDTILGWKQFFIDCDTCHSVKENFVRGERINRKVRPRCKDKMPQIYMITINGKEYQILKGVRSFGKIASSFNGRKTISRLRFWDSFRGKSLKFWGDAITTNWGCIYLIEM